MFYFMFVCVYVCIYLSIEYEPNKYIDFLLLKNVCMKKREKNTNQIER